MNALREIIASFGFEVETGELDKGDQKLNDFTKKLLDFGKVAVGAFSIAGMVKFGAEMVRQAAEVKDAAIALGLPAQQLQQLEHAAQQSGLGVEELRASLSRLNRVAAGSAAGGGQAEAFKKLGVNLKNADGTLKTSGQLFEEAGVAIGQIENPVERAGVASEIFGKSYAKLLPLFAEGGAGIKKLKKDAEELGIVFDQAFLENSDAIDDALEDVKKGFRGVLINAIAPFLPAAARLAALMVRGVKGLVSLAKTTRIFQVALTGLAVGGIGAFLKGGAKVVSMLGGWKTLFSALGRIIYRTLLPMLMLEDVFVFLTGGKSVTGAAFDRIFGKGTTKSIQETVRAWLDADDKIGTAGWGLVLALKIVWTEIKFGFLLAGAAIEDGFDSVWNGIVDGAKQALTSMGELLRNVPGLGDLKEGIASGIEKLEGMKLKGGNADEVRAERDRERLKIAEEGDMLKKSTEKISEGGDKLKGAAGELNDAAANLRGAAGAGAPSGEDGPPGRAPSTPAEQKFVEGYDKISTKFARPKKPPPVAGVKNKVVAQFDAFAARFDAPKASVPAAPAPGNFTSVNAPANVNQNFYVQGNVDKATVPTLRKQMREGANEALDLRATKAAVVRQAG